MTDPAISARLARKARLNELDGCWLEIRCGKCRQTTLYPLKLMARQRGPVPLGAILPRLSCRHCKIPPVEVHLNETPHREPGMSVTPGWSVQLVPAMP